MFPIPTGYAFQYLTPEDKVRWIGGIAYSGDEAASNLKLPEGSKIIARQLMVLRPASIRDSFGYSYQGYAALHPKMMFVYNPEKRYGYAERCKIEFRETGIHRALVHDNIHFIEFTEK